MNAPGSHLGFPYLKAAVLVFVFSCFSPSTFGQLTTNNGRVIYKVAPRNSIRQTSEPPVSASGKKPFNLKNVPPRQQPIEALPCLFKIDGRAPDWRTNVKQLESSADRAEAAGDFLMAATFSIKSAYGQTFAVNDQRARDAAPKIKKWESEIAQLEQERQTHEKFGNTSKLAEIDRRILSNTELIRKTQTEAAPLDEIQFGVKLFGKLAEEQAIDSYATLIQILMFGHSPFIPGVGTRSATTPERIAHQISLWRVRLAKRASEKGVPKNVMDEALALNEVLKQLEEAAQKNDIDGIRSKAVDLWKKFLE